MKNQGWENFFKRLHGPVYTTLVRDFWIHALSDEHYVISDVKGKRVVISEKSIVVLLGMKLNKGKRVHSMSNKTDFLKQRVIPTIYTQRSDEKAKPKATELFNHLRIWLKIILGCIHTRSSTSSSDFANTDQKYMLYFLKEGIKMDLPFILFNFLRDSVKEFRDKP